MGNVIIRLFNFLLHVHNIKLLKQETQEFIGCPEKLKKKILAP